MTTLSNPRTWALVLALCAAAVAQARTFAMPHVFEQKGSLATVATPCPSSTPVRDTATGQASGHRQHGPACSVSAGDVDGDGRADRLAPSSRGNPIHTGHVTLIK